MPWLTTKRMADATIPAAQPRSRVGALAELSRLVHMKIPDRNHDLPLHLQISLDVLDGLRACVSR